MNIQPRLCTQGPFVGAQSPFVVSLSNHGRTPHRKEHT